MAATYRRVTKKIFLVLNILAAVCFLMACAAPYVNPKQWWFVSIMGLGFAFIIITLIAFIFFWLVLKPKFIFISLIPLLIGWKRCLLTQSPKWLLLSLALLTWVLVRPHNQWQALARWAGGENAGGTLISGWAGCLTLIPLIALLALCLLISQLPDDDKLIDREALASGLA